MTQLPHDPSAPAAPVQEDTTTTSASADSSSADSTTSSTADSTTSSTDETTTTEEESTTTSSSTSTSSTTTASSTTATPVRASNSDSGTSGASLALAAVLLLALLVGGGVLLWRARNNALARKSLTSRVSHVLGRAQDILAWLSAQDGDPSTTPPVGVPTIDDLQSELMGLSAQIAGARRAAQADDRSATPVLNDLDRATRDLMQSVDQPQVSAFRVAVARTRGWLDGG